MTTTRIYRHEDIGADFIPTCGCTACGKRRAETKKHLPIQERLHDKYFRYGCVKCGNKRCPHRSDHRNECSNSNEPGQLGSDYE